MSDSSRKERDEIADKQRWWNTATVNARMGDTFAEPDHASVAVLLSGLVGDVPGADADASDAATCRLMLDALKVSEGDLGKLALWVEYARRDPRDLLAAAEYRRELGGTMPGAREADLAEYLEWCAGGRGGPLL